MLLVNPDDVLARASMSRTLSGASDVAASVIEGAGALVETMLSTSFERAAVREYFNDPSRNTIGALDLGRMFVDALEPNKLYVSKQGIMPPETGEEAGSEYYYFWPENSMVILNDVAVYRYSRFSFEYTAGFEESGGVAQGVPSWLREIVISGALYVLQTQVISHQKSIEQRDYSAILKQHLHALVAPRIRLATGKNYPTFTLPITTED